MSTAAASIARRHSDELRPPHPGGRSAGFAMSVLAHLGLVVALAFAVNWHASEPVTMSAELWSSVPQVAAAPEVAPPTPPQPVVKPPPPAPKPEVKEPDRDAQIAIEKKQEREKQLKREAEEKDRQEKLEKEKLLKQQQQEKLEQQRKQKEEDARLAKAREEQLKRITGMAGATGAATSTGSALRDAAPSANYIGRIVAAIKPNIVFTDDLPSNPRAEVKVLVAPDGSIISAKITQSSGSQAWDDAVVRAFERTQKLPRDTDGSVPSSLTFGLRPRDVK